MHLDLLVGPVMLRAQGDVVRILDLTERALDMMLAAVSSDDLGIAPVVVVGEEQRLLLRAVEVLVRGLERLDRKLVADRTRGSERGRALRG